MFSEFAMLNYRRSQADSSPCEGKSTYRSSNKQLVEVWIWTFFSKRMVERYFDEIIKQVNLKEKRVLIYLFPYTVEGNYTEIYWENKATGVYILASQKISSCPL